MLLIPLTLLIFACSSPQKRAEQARHELASWAATGQLLSDDFARGATTTRYVKSTIDVATDSLESLAEPLGNDAKSKAALWTVTQTFEGFSRAVESSDRAAAQHCTRQFAAVSRELQQEKEASQQ